MVFDGPWIKEAPLKMNDECLFKVITLGEDVPL